MTLGVGLLYKKLNRYEKGLEHVSRGLDYLDRGLAVDSCSWPGLPLQPLVSQYAFPGPRLCLVFSSVFAFTDTLLPSIFPDRPVFSSDRLNKISNMIDLECIPHEN